ncbi:MAG TPA: zf-HC2 domain-containing protein [Dissulfuribacter thermophilus]|uniref:Zf-HC2 domain-containing protein n=1 Tax=Dissulfuribacter thermophilus TaxID=1156395 RepID=A0A7V2WSQ4_9BACT|nr:zf-HC2 domain-containing protein [Dissulfuribacter thermophilus]
MNCNETKEFLFDYLKNRLPFSYQQDVQQHLSKCPECRAHEEELKELFELLDTAGPIEPSADFVQRVMERIERLEKIEQRDKGPIHNLILIFKEFFKKLTEKSCWPVPAVALATIAIAIVATNIFWQGPFKVTKPTMVTTKELKINVNIPPSIIIESQRDILPDVSSLIEGYGGRIIGKKQQGKAIILRIKIPKKYERSFVESLRLLGDTRIGNRYKNENQEIIIKILHT